MANTASKYPTVGPRWGAQPRALSPINTSAVSAPYRDGSLCSVISYEEMHKIRKTYLWKPPQVCPVLDRQVNRWRTVTLVLFRLSFKFWFWVGTYVWWRASIPFYFALNLFLSKQVPLFNGTKRGKPLFCKSGLLKQTPLSPTDPRLILPRWFTNHLQCR